MQPSSPEKSLFAGGIALVKALQEMRLRLLDLTGRNRLINFKPSPGKSLQLVHTAMDAAYQRLMVEGGRLRIAPLPEPRRPDWVERSGRLQRPDPKEYAAKVGIDPAYDLHRRAPVARNAPAVTGNEAYALFYADDLGKHCRKIEREAKLAIEETGANMLYLVLGQLEYPEDELSDKLLRAPLVCVPVGMVRVEEGQYPSFFLTYNGDELAENLSLREKLKRDFGLALPEFDEEAGSVENFLDRVSSAVKERPRWSVKRTMTLALLSFTNMLLVRDLDPANWPVGADGEPLLLTHPLVRQVFEGRPETDSSPIVDDEVRIDEHPMADLPLIFDADSSQHRALIDVLEGKNRVIEGPPGTGKSQTITNLIAAALHQGKKVLFVAEKLAALQVVQDRLTRAALDPFVLELHSNKTTKKQLLEAVARRQSLQLPAQNDLPALLEQHAEKRQALKAYADLMNSVIGNAMGLTLHQVLWKAERHRGRLGASANALLSIRLPGAGDATMAQFRALCDRMRQLGEHYARVGGFNASHPLWGLFPKEYRPQDDVALATVLRTHAPRLTAMSMALASLANLLGREYVNMPAPATEALADSLNQLSPADRVLDAVLPRVFHAGDPNAQTALAALDELQALIQRIDEAETSVRLRLTSADHDEERAAKAAKLAPALALCGWSGMHAQQLTHQRDALQTATQALQLALARVREFTTALGVPFDSTRAALADYEAMAAVVARSPVAHLHLRHAGLRGPTAVSTLLAAQQKAHKLAEMRSELDGSLYLDAVPGDGDLTAAIDTLREGQAWYRMFQSRWRKAIALHRRLERNKSKLPATKRLRDLEMLREHEREQAAMGKDTVLAALAGESFRGAATPLLELSALAKWIAQFDDVRLRCKALAACTLDPLGADRAVVLRLVEAAKTVPVALAALTEFETVVARLLPDAGDEVLAALRNEDLTHRLGAAGQVTELANAAQALLGQTAVAGITAADAFAALKMRSEVGALREAVRALPAAQTAFGEHFCGRDTDLALLRGTLGYGRAVKSLQLPPAIEERLLSASRAENHALLTRYVEQVRAGWKDIEQFNHDMARLGRFESDQWCDPAGMPSSSYAIALVNKINAAQEHAPQLMAWTQYVGAREDVVQRGLEPLAQAMEQGAITAHQIEIAFAYRFLASIAESVFESSPTLRQFSGVRHSGIRQEYADLDRRVVQLRGQEVARAAKQRANPPPGSGGLRVDEKTEMRLLEHLIPQQRPRVPVRQILRRAGRAIQELKPCFMMGPQAVAQFLEPGLLHFDLIIMDEASQLKPEEAIGAIARGTQLVVVGDPKQLPPTSFFSRMGADHDDEAQLAAAEAESILDVCIGHFQPVRTLRWHYRSQHESLIAFSNHHFYNGRLLVFPSPYPKSKALGLRYQYIKGAYEGQMNMPEAHRVIEAIVDHVLNRPGDSLGVVTLNIKQRDLISELFEEKLRALPVLADYCARWKTNGHEVFIKNLETVQGDERDAIIVSTTFGPPPGATVVRQNFGPISRDGGWRRLNVLFTRARKSICVITSMRPEDIAVDGRTPEGTRALRHYLDYARSGRLIGPDPEKPDAEPESDFEAAVIDALRQRGYEVQPQLGVAGFRIDIAVRHPQHRSGYLAAVECDGATYHSGTSVRDRDRIRQQILEALGWEGRIWRIWSTDWFRNPLGEMDKLCHFLRTLEAQPLRFSEETVEDNVPDAQLADTATAPEAGDTAPAALVLDDEDVDIEIDVGDLVTYASAGTSDESFTVRVTAHMTDPAMGLVAEHTPLAQTLLGATVGDTVVLRVPGQPPQAFEIKGVKRAASAGSATAES